MHSWARWFVKRGREALGGFVGRVVWGPRALDGVGPGRYLNVVDADPADRVVLFKLQHRACRARRHPHAGLVDLPGTAIGPFDEIVGAAGPGSGLPRSLTKKNAAAAPPAPPGPNSGPRRLRRATGIVRPEGPRPSSRVTSPVIAREPTASHYREKLGGRRYR